MKKINLTSNSSYIIFFMIAIFYAVGNFIWWKINTPIIPYGVSAYHLQGAISDNLLYTYAPLLSWIMKIMFFVFGTKYYDLEIIFVNYIFILLSLFFIYKLGVEVKDKFTGNLSMILFSLTPSIYIMSRQYGHQDWHIVAPIIFNIYCLLKTKEFTNKKWSIIYGISVGIGLLVKDTFLYYFFVPLLFLVIYSLTRKVTFQKILNILIAIMACIILAGIHYFRIQTIDKLFEDYCSCDTILTFETTRCLTVGLWEELLSPPIFILFIMGLIYFITRYKQNDKKIILLLYFIVPWLAIFFMKHYKSFEYCLAFVPILILIASIYLTSISNKIIKRIILVSILIISLGQYVAFSYFPKEDRKIFNNIYYYNEKVFNRDVYYFGRKNFDKDEDLENKVSLILFLKKQCSKNKIVIPKLPTYVFRENIFILSLTLYCIDYVFSNNDNVFVLDSDIEDCIDNLNKENIVLFVDNLKKEYIYQYLELENIEKNERYNDEEYIDNLCSRIKDMLSLLKKEYDEIYKIETYCEDIVVLRKKIVL